MSRQLEISVKGEPDISPGIYDYCHCIGDIEEICKEVGIPSVLKFFVDMDEIEKELFEEFGEPETAKAKKELLKLCNERGAWFEASEVKQAYQGILSFVEGKDPEFFYGEARQRYEGLVAELKIIVSELAKAEKSKRKVRLFTR